MSASRWLRGWGFNYVQVPHHNGVTGYTQQLQRVTLKFCKHKPHSRGVRDYIEQHLIQYAKDNPSVAVYLKPRRHKTPVIVAEYCNGHEEYLNLGYRPVDEVARWVEHYTHRSGMPTVLLESGHHTHTPSVQGNWTPWTNRHPSTLNQDYPNEEGLAADKWDYTATDQLRDMAKAGTEEVPQLKMAEDTRQNMQYGPPK